MKTWKVEAAIIAVGMVLLGVIIKWGTKVSHPLKH